MPRNLKIGLVVLFVGIVPLLFTIYKLHSHKWDVLKTPLVISPGQFTSPAFSTDLDGRYVVSLAFDTLPDIHREDCLIGWESPNGSCKDISPTLNFEWTVIGDVGSIENGGHFKVYAMSGAGEDEVLLGTFEAKRTGRQEIVLNILSDAGELNNAHPRLKVQAHRVYWEKWVIFNQMAWLFALILGFGWTVTFLWGKVRAQPKISTPLFLIILSIMTASGYAVMRWVSLTGFASEIVPFALQESRNWGIAAIALECGALALSLFSTRTQSKYWFVRAPLCILGTVGIAVLFYFFHNI